MNGENYTDIEGITQKEFEEQREISQQAARILHREEQFERVQKLKPLKNKYFGQHKGRNAYWHGGRDGDVEFD